MTVDLSPEYVEQLASNLPRCLPDAPALYTAADTLRTLAAENARLRAENDLMAQSIDAKEIEAGLSTNGGFWRWWSAQARDLAARNARLSSECDAAWQAGAEAMREAAALAAEDCGGRVPGGDSSATRYVGTSMDAADRIRALPIPDKEGEV